MAEIFELHNFTTLLLLIAICVALNIDNVIVIGLQASALEPEKRASARKQGIILAMLARIALVLCLKWLLGFDRTLFTIPLIGHAVSGRDIIFLVGGGYLLVEAVGHIHNMLFHFQMQKEKEQASPEGGYLSLLQVLKQMFVANLIFSFDSVMTVIGYTSIIAVMISAIVVSSIIMLIFANPLSDFIQREVEWHIFALILMASIGVKLTLDAIGLHIDDARWNFAMGYGAVAYFPVWLYHKKRRIKNEGMERKELNSPLSK